MKLVFLLPVLTQPRYWKRIRALADQGADARVLAFRRPYVPPGEGVWEDVHIVGTLQHGRYLRRVAAFARAFPHVFAHTRGAEVLYCFSSDLAVLGLIVRLFRPRLRIVVEVGDVRTVMDGRGLGSRSLRLVERWVLRSTSLLVVTSAAYRDEYYVPVQGFDSDRMLVVENKVDARISRLSAQFRRAPSRPKGQIVIGYYGLIRCRKSWDVLKQVAEACSDRFRIEVWGRLFIKGFEPDLAKLPPAMVVHDAYRHPDDLPTIYAEADLIWVAHGYASTNTRWGRANRFYEACSFATPLIGQRDTLDGAEIQRKHLGLCIELNDPGASVQQISDITHDDIAEWQNQLLLLDPSVYRYTDEHERLYNRLQENGGTSMEHRVVGRDA